MKRETIKGTSWSAPKTNIIAGMNALRQCLASGYKARLIRVNNEECGYPIKEDKYYDDFRCYEFSSGHGSSVNKIKAMTNMSDFEKHLSLNYISVFGTKKAADDYYKTGVLSADNFKSPGYNHLVHVDDYIEYLEGINDYQRAEMYRREHRAPEHANDVVHFFDFFKLKKEFTKWNIKKFNHKLWVVQMLDKDEPAPKTPILAHIIAAIVYPLKFIPQKSVLCMPEYTNYKFRIGGVTNGFCVEFQIPKKFSFK